MISLANKESGYDSLDQNAVERLSNAFVEALHRKRMERELQHQFESVNLIDKIVSTILERHDLDSIFRVVLNHLERHLSADLCSVFLFDPQENILIVAAYGEESKALVADLNLPEGTAIPVEETGMRECLEGKTVCFSDETQVKGMLHQMLARTDLCSVIAVPMMARDKPIGLLVMGDDFSSSEIEFLKQLSERVALAINNTILYSDLQQAYDELRQTQQAIMRQERLHALGQMASGIAHDINNALSPITGYAQLLLLNEQIDDDTREYLEKINMASQDIANIVKRMRQFYRKREEQEQLLPVDLNKVVEEVIELTEPRWKDMPQKQGTFIKIKTIDPTPPSPIMGIESELRQALTNLIINAVDAISQEGVVTFRIRSAQDKVILEVADTGEGMDEETRQHCLEPFYTTKGKGGTGLGLAMVYGTMQRHDGDIEIESELGKGTTVRLIFPVPKPEEAELNVPTKETVGQIRPLRILVIDDEAKLRQLMKDILETDGHTVVLADDGRTGVDAFCTAKQQDEPFDLVITDLGMPEMDGHQVTHAIKRESASTPVILLTGWGNRMNAENTPTEVDAVLSKPPEIEKLRGTLTAVL